MSFPGDQDPSERQRTRRATRPAAQAADPQVTEERDQFRAAAQRAASDLDSFRRRARREQEQSTQKATARCVRELLPLISNFERALEHVPDGSVADGVRMLQRELEEALGRLGATSFSPAGEPFDPHRHEALAIREGGGSGLVVEVVSRGWVVGEELVAPARVVVAQ